VESSFTRTVGDFTHSLGRVGIDLLNGGLASPCHKVVIGYIQLLVASELPPHSLTLHPDDRAAVGPRLLIRQAKTRLFRG